MKLLSTLLAGSVLLFDSGLTAQDAQKAHPLGLVAKAPKNAEGVIAFYDLGEVRETFLESAFWDSVKTLAETADEELDLSMDDVQAEVQDVIQGLFSDDMVIILGEGSGGALQRLLKFSRLYDKMTYKTLGSVGLMGGMGMDSPDQMLAMASPELLDELTGMMNGFTVPRITMLCSTADAKAIHAKIPTTESQDGVTVGTFKNAAGHEVTSFTMNASDFLTKKTRRQILKDLPEDRKAAAGRLIDSLSELEMVLSLGPVDDTHYALTMGPDAKQENFAAGAGSSITSVPSTAFANQWLDRKLFNFVYFSEELGRAMQTHNPFSPLLEALGEVLSETDGLEGLAARLTPRLDELVTEGDALMAFEKVTEMVGVSFWEKGLRVEAQGGPERAGYDLEGPLRFQAPEGAFVVAQNRALPGHSLRTWNYLESISAAVYEGGLAFAEMQGGADNPQVAQGMAMAQMVAPSLEKVYGKVRNALAEGLGDEGMFVLDFGGAMPQLPDVPASFVERGRVPRLALVYPVKDRDILARNWEEIPPIANDLFESMGTPMRVPSTMSSDSDGLKTHFFPLPYLSDDVMPSTSLSDEIFILGTSKNLATAIAGAAAQKDGATGALISMDFGPLQEYVGLWKEIALDEGMLPADGEDAAAMDLVLSWLEGLHGIDSRVWKEEDQLRSSFHLGFGDIPAQN